MSESPSLCNSLQEAKNGDNESLTLLLSQYRPYVTLWARLWRDEHTQAKVDDSDLVQETMLNAFRSFPEFRGTTEAEFEAWLRTIMSHVSVNTIRFYSAQQRDVRRELHPQAFDGHALVDPRSSPSEQLMKRERAVVLARALEQLRPEYREVLILRELESLPLREVAHRLNRSVNGAKQLWIRAVMQMREVMREHR